MSESFACLPMLFLSPVWLQQAVADKTLMAGAEKDNELNLQMLAHERAKYFRAVRRLFQQPLGAMSSWRWVQRAKVRLDR